MSSGVVSHREELIQCIAPHTHCGVLEGRMYAVSAPGLNPARCQ
jgi:hypothetical protein